MMRHFLQNTAPRLVLFTCVLCATSTYSWAKRPDDAPPNILFLLIDDMGWGDLACYGHAFHETPRIDELAAGGMRFTNFYAATPVCSSTRSTIQTGQYSARTGMPMQRGPSSSTWRTMHHTRRSSRPPAG